MPEIVNLENRVEHRPVGIKELEDRRIAGYSQILRPRLLIGRFRGPERDPGKLLNDLAGAFAKASVRWAVTRGRAAYELQHFWRS